MKKATYKLTSLKQRPGKSWLETLSSVALDVSYLRAVGAFCSQSFSFKSLEFATMLSFPLKGLFYEGTDFSRRCYNFLEGTHLTASY